MRNRSDEKLRRIPGQDRVRIERYDVAYESEPAGLANDRGERITRSPPQEFVELGELATLPFPAHPHVLLRIPQPRAMEKKKHIFARVSVPRVEVLYSRRCGGENPLIVRPVLGR